MASPVTTIIKVKTYLKDYLLNQYGNDEGIIEFQRGNNILNRLQSFINKPPEKIIKPDCYVEVLLPFSETRDPRVYNYLSVNSQKIIARDIYYEFFSILHRHIMLHEKTMYKEEAYILFYETYKINESNISLQTLKKNHYRYMNRKVKKTIINVSSSDD